MGCGISQLTTGNKVVALDKKPPLSSERIVCNGEGVGERENAITIVHFNDVYNIDERNKEPVGGAARFKTRLDSLQELNPLVLFSGDALNPSNMSTVTEGRQMVPVLNSFGVHAAVFGNHEFDFGLEHLLSITNQTNFPWLLSNVIDTNTGRLLAEGKETLIVEWEGRKIGLMGLVEKEWLVCLATIEPEEVEYTDYVTCAKKLLPKLKQQGCDLLVAMTHMRMPNDLRLAKEVQELHLILAGHDHHYETKQVGETLIIKSGSDFRDFSQISVTFDPTGQSRPNFDVIRHTITKEIAPDPEISAVVEKYVKQIGDGFKEEIGWIDCSLEGRFSLIRTQETNLGNLVTDIMRHALRVDVALLNSGTLRSDAVHETGAFTVQDLVNILPMMDVLVVLEVTGNQILEALENGVSQYPKHEGRFPQVSGLSFTFNPSKPVGSRILTDKVLIGGEPLERTRTYKLCTKSYIANGRDGYLVFRGAKMTVGLGEGPILSSIVKNHFTMCSQKQRQSQQCLLDEDCNMMDFEELDWRINPQVEGRIVILN